MHIFKTLSLLVAACLILNSCSIHPQAWTPPTKPTVAQNNLLQNASSISLLGYAGAEDFAQDTNGNIYCGTHRSAKDFSSGAILKISPTDDVEVYMKTEGWVTGLAFDKEGNLWALIGGTGLIKISPDKSIDTVLTATPNGAPILMGAGLVISNEGAIYFTNISSEKTTNPKYIQQLILELKPTGGIYQYNPSTERTTVISNGNYFGNDLILSPEEDFLIVSETSKYRLLKYWLTGEKKGQHEVFMDNLPGFPNNLTPSRDGGFWIGYTTKRNDQLDAIHPKPGMKKVAHELPSFLQPKPDLYGMVMEVDWEGREKRILLDPDGHFITEAGGIKEINEHLYLGGDVVEHISKVALSE